MSYVARLVETGEVLPCHAGRMGPASRCLVIRLPDGRRVEVEYRPDVIDPTPPILREVTPRWGGVVFPPGQGVGP